MNRPNRLRLAGVVMGLLALALAPALWSTPASVTAQNALSCEPAMRAATPAATTGTPLTPVEPPEDAVRVKVGFVAAVSIYAPIYVALDKGYFAEEGIDVSLEVVPTGSDMVALTATGDFDLGVGGVGPAFWNAMAGGLPLKVIAPGHAEGNPVATPLMISKAACESGEIASVADLKGKKVSVNARGATEYWLAQALGTGGLTMDDIELQTLQFQDAIAALQSGALDAAIIAEPLATAAEQQGIAVRLTTDFPVQDIQPTVVYGNQSFLDEHPDAVTAFAAGYIRACREMMAGGWTDPAVLAIVEKFTGVPADLVARSIHPVYATDGRINVEGLAKLQTFFRERGQLEYETDLDPATLVDARFVEAALEELGPA